MNKVNSLWEEKYRPASLNEYICNDDDKSKLQEYIDKNDIPHLILYGDAGGGKTTLAKLLISNIKCDSMYVNASDENGIEAVRTRIKGFASISSFNPLKIIHLDEGDKLTPDAQDALKGIVETYSNKTRFIFTTNHLHKLIDPLQSRCTLLEIKPDSIKKSAHRLADILELENIEYDAKDVVKILNEHFPDIRACIRTLQHNIVDGILVLSNLNIITKTTDDIIKLLTGSNSNKWMNIRQLISDNSIRQFTSIYKNLYNNIEFISKGRYEEIIIILAEHEYYDYFVPDKEINFMACISKILKILK